MVVLSFFVWRRRDWARPWLRDFPASFNRKRSVSHSISRLFERNWRSTPQLLLEIPDPVQKVIFDWEHLHSIINATCRGKSLYHGPEADICGLSFFIPKKLRVHSQPSLHSQISSLLTVIADANDSVSICVIKLLLGLKDVSRSLLFSSSLVHTC